MISPPPPPAQQEHPRKQMFWTTLWEKELPQKKRNWNLALYAIFTQMEAIPGDSGQVSIKGLR